MKNRTLQLIFQSFFIAFGLVGTAGSVGLFNYEYSWDFYLYFTNLGTYLCIAVMCAELIQTAKRQGDGYVSALPRLKFVSMLGCLLIFLVFNLLLANEPGRDRALNFKVGSVMFHMLLPVMYIADWFLFYERGRVKWTLPLLSPLLPLGYAACVYLHAWFFHFDSSISNYEKTGPLIYPYFFLNLEEQGIAGVARWIGLLLIGFIAAGYFFYLLDHAFKKRKRT